MSAMLPAFFAKLATCVDPFIYTLNQPKIRTEILRRLHLLLSVKPQSSSSGLVTSYNPGLSTRRPNICCSCRRRIDSQRQRIINNRRSARSSLSRALEPSAAVDRSTGTTVRSTGHLGPSRPINNATLYHERKCDKKHHSIKESNLAEGGDGNLVVERSSRTIVADLNEKTSKINKKVQSADDAIRRCNNISIDKNSSNEQSTTDYAPLVCDSSRIMDSILIISKTSLLTNTELFNIDFKSKETLI